MGDAHHGVVDDGGEVVGGSAVGAEDDEVVQVLGLELDVAVDGVVDHHVAAVQGDLDAQGVGLSGLDAALGLLGVDVTAGALVALEGVVTLLGRLLVCGQLLGGAEAGVGLTLVPELLGSLLVDVQTVGLLVGTEVAALVGTLVPVQAQPLHGAQDDLRVLLGGAGGVGVVDAQDEGAVVGAGECPVIDGRTGASYVKLSRGGGSEAHANGLLGGAIQKMPPVVSTLNRRNKYRR